MALARVGEFAKLPRKLTRANAYEWHSCRDLAVPLAEPGPRTVWTQSGTFRNAVSCGLASIFVLIVSFVVRAAGRA